MRIIHKTVQSLNRYQEKKNNTNLRECVSFVENKNEDDKKKRNICN